MSCSRKHVPVVGNTTANSEKDDKRAAHGRARARLREALATGDAEAAVAADEHRRSGRATFAKDGRTWRAGAPDRLLRK